MIKESKIVFSIFFIVFVLIGLTSINATSENITQDMYSESTFQNKLNTGELQQSNTNTHVLNTKSFSDYVTDGRFNDKVTAGDTIDIQGKLDGSKFALEIDKPVNIISSTGDSYYNSHTIGNGGYGYNNYDNIFVVSNGGSGTNITGINFHNTQVRVINANDVCVDNVTCICEQNVGNNVGSFNIRGGSNNITVKNSYFMNYPNGGHSNVVIAGASNCLIENNTILCSNTNGITGNLLYLTTYFSDGKSNYNITIRNNTIRTMGRDYPTNYGLALEGSGHIIEGNIIDNAFPVMAQYADPDYGIETNIDTIIFNNNTIIRGTPQLVFPGIVANNTFNDGALLKQVQVYNNTFNKVTIQNNVKFENNTAKNIIIDGNNNTLDNNVVYSEDEYAVTISGENNTLKNNKLLSNNTFGEDTINNETVFFSINNSEKMSRIFYITDDNIGNYFNDVSSSYGWPAYTTKDNMFNDGDILIFNVSFDEGLGYMIQDTNQNMVDLIIANTTASLTPQFKKSLTLINSFIPHAFQKNGALSTLSLINSTIGAQTNLGSNFNKDNESIIISDYKYFLQNYPYVALTKYIPVLDKNGNILADVELNSNILVSKYVGYTNTYNAFGASSMSLYRENIYVNKPLNFIAVPKLGIIGSNVHLMDGSSGTTFTGITFENNVFVESDNVKFINCTFNKNVELKNNMISLQNNLFNGNLILNSSNNTVFNENIINSSDILNVLNTKNTIFENNTIITTANNTIVFDDDSSNNVVRNNVLVASSLVGDDSVVAGDNIVEDNIPSYDTQIIIGVDNQAFADDNLEVNITVYDLNNSKPVSKGYVEVYYDGYLIDIKDLTDGTTSVIIPIADYVDGSDSYPIKVWYYEGKRYNNNITTKNINVVKSNVSISVDEFTAKLNEKATVTATFLNQNGNSVSDTNVTFTVGRSSFTVETVDGVATLDEMVTREWLDSGKITVSFPSTDAYNANSTTIGLNTSKADVLMVPVVSVDGNVADVELTLSDALGVNVTDGRIVLSTLDGQELASGRVSNGKFTSNVALPDGYSDEYIVANFTGSYYYNDFVRNVKITQMLNSTISLETNSPLYGEELVINGKLVDSKNTPIGGANLTLNLNGSKVIVTTNDDGEYNYTYTPGLGVNSLTVTFDGNSDIYGSSASKDVTIRDTDREMNEVLNRLDDLQKENDKLREQLEQLQEQNNKTSEQLDNITQANNELKEQLANQTANLTEQNKNLQEQLNNLTKDNNDLSEQLNDTKNNLTQQNNDLQEQNKELNDKLDSTAKNLTDANKDLQEQNKELNDKLDSTAKNLTDANKALQEQNKALHDQNKQLNDKLDAILKQLEDSVAKDAVITVNSIPGAKFGQNVTISGKLSDCDGNVIASSPVSVSVGGIAQKVTTDKDGVYNLTVRASVVGDNSVVVSFDADNKYNYAENTTTFKVARQNLVLKLDSIKSVYYGDKVKITGVLSDANGKLIANTLLNLNINGKTVKVKTVAGGKFTYTVAAKTVGTNNVTVSYNGNKNYNGVSAKKTFKVY
ncbi:MAG: hypothetical protein IJI98_00005, partial [Methanosphaera sp.]|nr:hypothetical protein [Methanosphaera sp.]